MIGTEMRKSLVNDLHIAVMLEDHESLDKILNKSTINIDSAEENGFTALHFAILKNNVKIVKKLLRRGADINYKGFGGVTPLDFAMYSDSEQMKNIFKI